MSAKLGFSFSGYDAVGIPAASYNLDEATLICGRLTPETESGGVLSAEIRVTVSSGNRSFKYIVTGTLDCAASHYSVPVAIPFVLPLPCWIDGPSVPVQRSNVQVEIVITSGTTGSYTLDFFFV